MTAQVDAYKHENNAVTHLIGQDWQKLIDMIESRPGDDEIKSFDGGGSQYQYRTEENILRTLQDVKRLRQKDMPLFGRCPETDNFYTVVCSTCSMILMPHVLKEHYDKRHGDASNNKSHSLNDKQTIESPSKSKSKKVQQQQQQQQQQQPQQHQHQQQQQQQSQLQHQQHQPAKSEKMEKSRRVKSELTEEVFKDSKRLDKLKKVKPVEKAPDLEYTANSSRSDRNKQKVRFGLELQPIVALSPIHVVENEAESNESKDLPKNKKRDKKKSERKADKIYDPDKHCGVINDNGKPCVRSILCKVHQVALKRAVPSRTMPYDMLIRILKNQNDEEKIKAENGLLRLPKIEPGEKVLPDIKEPQNGEIQASKTWTNDQTNIKTEEPPNKRLKIKEEVIEDDVDQNQFTLPSHLEALIDETLKTLKDVDENETLPIIPVAPKPEPLIKWDYERKTMQTSPAPATPPPIFLDDIHWHSSHPKPLATNTFGCRLIGGLMSTCKKLDTLRKHLQSVWTSSASSPQPVRSAFNDVYNSSTAQNTNSTNAVKNNITLCKYSKKPNQSKTTTVVKKNVPTVLAKSTVAKRKRRSNSNVIASVQNATSNASDIISGLLISNPVSVQRTGSTTVPTIPTGVIPVNSITGNGVPLRLFQGSLPVIASASPNQPATFIQLNLCPPK